MLDPQWSTDLVEILHDGADAEHGVEKMRADRGPAAARRSTCGSASRTATACTTAGEKCVRTGVAVRIAGVEGSFASLPSPSLRQVASVGIVGLGMTWNGYHRELKRTKANERLRWAIEVALTRRRLKTWPGVGRWIR